MAQESRLSSDQFAAVQPELEQVLPLMQEAAAETLELEIAKVAETSCLRPEIKEQHEQTRWEGILQGAPADSAAANAAVDNMKAALQAQGWTVSREENAPDEDHGTVREVFLDHGGLHTTIRYARRPEHTMAILVVTDCTDHSEDHQMLRSPLDPGYGRSSQYYPDGA